MEERRGGEGGERDGGREKEREVEVELTQTCT